MRRQEWSSRVVVTAAGDVAIAIAAVVAAAWLRRNVPIPFTRDILLAEKFPLSAQTVAPFALTLLVALFTAGFYSRSTSPRHRPTLFVTLPLQVALLAIVSTILETPWPRSLLFGAPGLAAVMLLLWRRALAAAWPRLAVQATLIGPCDIVSAAATAVRTGHVPGVAIRAIVTTDGPLADPSWAGAFFSDEGRAAIDAAETPIDLTGSEEVRLMMVELCAPRAFLYDATLTDAISSESSLRTFGNSVLAEVRFDACRGLGAVTKRGMDVAFGSVAAVLASPVVALAALATVLDSGGPVFVRQQRLGLRGRTFRMWKLRTMVRGSETRPASLAREDDARVTGVGRWLRRYRVDELPQLINVVSGDMSLVGPRPEIPDVSESIRQRIPAFHLRLLVRPGIAGLAQVESEYDQEPAVKLRYDLHYICTWSALLDAELLARSVIAALSGRGV